MLTTITNLFPRPDDPNRGLYNYRLFNELHALCATTSDATTYTNICLVPEWRIWRWPTIRRWGQEEVQSPKLKVESSAECEAPGGRGLSEPLTEERVQSPKLKVESSAECEAPGGRGLSEPLTEERVQSPKLKVESCEAEGRVSFIPHTSSFILSSTRYIPVFTLPFLGRSINWWFYYRGIRGATVSTPTLDNTPHPSPLPQGAREQTYGANFLVPWLYPDGVAVARSVRGTAANLWLMALGSDTFHLKSPIRRQRILEACTQAKGIICVAQVLADRLAAAGVPLAKLHVIPNGVSPLTPTHKGRGSKSPLTPTLSHKGRGSRASILYVGNLVPVKGPDILLQAFASLTSQQSGHATATLTLIGAGPMRAKLERLARTLGIGDHVTFLGRRPPEEVADWMNRADVLCLPSRSEGMPNVVLEARACGLPVVTSPAGAIPELPLDKAHFLVVPACTPSDLALGLHDMLSRDLSKRIPDPNIPTWNTMAERILAKIARGV